MNSMDVFKKDGVQLDTINSNAAQFPDRFVAECEGAYARKIRSIANTVKSSIRTHKIILLSGPSSSGKTTTANKIKQALGDIGVGCIVISLDDFYRDKVDIPRLPDGSYDFESIEALDIPCINTCFKELVETGRSDFPVFDFVTAARSRLVNHVTLTDGGVMIIEGIHALNPRLLERELLPQVYKIYVCVQRQVMDRSGLLLSAKDIRLVRRMIRDNNFRNTPPSETLAMWKNVCDGEERYIKPFKHAADVVVDTFHLYEPCVYHHYLLPVLAERAQGKPLETFIRLEERLQRFADIDKAHIPADSLLREFIG